jgi:ribosome-associated protein
VIPGVRDPRDISREGYRDLVGEPPPPGESPVLVVTRHCRIPRSELTWRFTTSGGPGGQHANRSHTAAEVGFDVAGSPSLGPRQRARLLEKLGPVVRAYAGDERSQTRNRDLALDRLRVRLAAALAVETPRVATRPSRGAKERRLEEKRRNSDRKRDLRTIGD